METQETLNIHKLNTQGIQLLEYKKELLKDYPQIIKDNLKDGIERMVFNKLISETLKSMLIDETISILDLKNYLLENPEFIKSRDEVYKEYELYKNKLYQTLVKQEIISKNNQYKIDIDEDNDTIDLVKTFSLDTNFVRLYFSVLDDRELSKLTKTKGFIEKFSALRLYTVANNFVEKYKNYDIDKFEISFDNPYIEEDGLAHSVEIIIKIKPLYLEKESLFKNTIIALENLIKLIDIYFEERFLV